MVELIIGVYGGLCWLLFKKFKVIPVTTYTVCTAILGGLVILALLFISLSVFHPVSHDGRTYAAIVQIVPNVRGTVVEVPVEANKPIKKGDVLFQIDPQPFQIEVDRLRAVLASKNLKFSQLNEQYAAAEAVTRENKANLLVAESQFDRQAREKHESALSKVNQVQKNLELAKANFDRASKLLPSHAISQEEYDRIQTNKLSLEQDYQQAMNAEKVEGEMLKSGSASLEAVRQTISKAEATERELRLQINAETDGLNPEVREVTAQLERARWELEQTTVRAPSDGYVPQLTLLPGQMATSLPMKPLMVFVSVQTPYLIASYAQKTIANIEPGLEGEAVFKAYPGRSFKVKVRRVLTALPEGDIMASGELLSTTSSSAAGYVPVVFDYDDDIKGLNLPAGAQASIAIYTHHIHALSLVRKIILRIKSWENYVF